MLLVTQQSLHLWFYRAANGKVFVHGAANSCIFLQTGTGPHSMGHSQDEGMNVCFIMSVVQDLYV